MLSIIYPISFLVSISGLIFWFYFQGNKVRSLQMSRIFLIGFFVYLFSLAFSEATLPFKLLILFRDLVIMGGVTMFFNYFKANKILFFGLLIALYAAFNFFFFKKMQQTFPQKSIAYAHLAQEGELLLEVKDGHQILELEEVLNQYDIKFSPAFLPERAEQTDLDDYYILDIPKGKVRKLKKIKEAIMDSGLADWVEENEVIQLAPLEGKPARLTGKNYGLNDPGLVKLWGFEEMKVDQYMQSLSKNPVTPKSTALIAILDTGVDSKHEDISANYVSTKSSYDNDPRGHGTHCAGIAAAVSNNGKGIASFSNNNQFVRVTSIKVLSSFGGGTQAGIIKGMILAADKSADVISMSLGGRSNDSKQRAYEKAVKYANDAGAIVVCAAGNNNGNAKNIAPGNTKGVITVSAVDSNLNRASFSNYVNDLEMAVAAPGVGIYSTIPNNNYDTYNGTSMATPYVAGLVGVLKSLRPKLTTKEAYTILNETGIKTKDTKQTGRFIQPLKALNEVMD